MDHQLTRYRTDLWLKLMTTSSTPDYTASYDDVSMFALDIDREEALLRAQTECTFMWTTTAGDPVGVIMNFLAQNGRFWLTCTRRRKRVPAIEARPRVAIAISSRGTEIGISQAVTYKGTGPIMPELIGGQVSMTFSTSVDNLQFVAQAGSDEEGNCLTGQD